MCPNGRFGETTFKISDHCRQAASTGVSDCPDLTWDEFNANGANVSGFRESRWKTVKRLKPGDLLVGYLTGVSRFIGLLEVTSDGFKADDPIWARESFPARVSVRPLITLTPETAVPVKTLKDRLSWFEEDAHPLAWTGRVRGSPTKLQPSDAEAIIAAMQEAEASPVHRSVDPKILNRTPRIYNTGPGAGELRYLRRRKRRGASGRWRCSPLRVIRRSQGRNNQQRSPMRNSSTCS
jgi:hypothetical protein